MTRYKHYLRKNANSRRPTSLVFLDCDSDSERLASGDVRETFKSAALITVRRRRDKYVVQHVYSPVLRASSVWDILESQARKRSRTLVVCATPVRVLTLLHHIDEMHQRGWTLDTPTSSSRFTAIAWRNDTRTLLFIAHSNLFPMHKLCNSGALLRAQQMCDTWIEYLKLLDEHDCGDFHLSLGAQALSIYRHRFMQHPILIHGDKRADEIEQRATFGGLYQPFVAGRAPGNEFYYLDTNAMYPAMMKQFPYPWRLAGVVGGCVESVLRERLRSHDTIATVYLETESPHYPVRVEGRTIFPVGKFTTTLTTPDLLYALRLNHIRDIYAVAWYDRAFLFTEFVTHFWNLRREFASHGKPLWASWAKAVMVSLYGRFGCHEFSTRDEGDNPYDCDHAGQMLSMSSDEARWYHTLAGKMWSSGRVGLQRDAFPAVMAHVAAYARNRMFDLIRMAGSENVFVVLSDGLIVNRAGFDRLQHENQAFELGKLKLKLSGEELEILSDVEFRLNVHTWRPGVKPDAVEVLDGVFVQHLDPNLGSLSHQNSVDAYVKRSVTLTLNRQFGTGQVEPSGRIVPLTLQQSPPAPPRIPRPSV